VWKTHLVFSPYNHDSGNVARYNNEMTKEHFLFEYTVERKYTGQ